MSHLSSERASTSLAGTLKAQIAFLGSWTVIAWGLEAVDQFVVKRSLDQYGIRPRDLDGLWGILCAPLLHGGFGHLAANTVPFLVLGWFVLAGRKGDFFLVSVIVIVLGGAGVWLMAPPESVHIGASGLIFGYLGFLLSRGLFERSLGSILVAVIVGLLYGGLIFGVLPGEPGVSWQGHLFGFVGGAIAAKLLAGTKPQDAT